MPEDSGVTKKGLRAFKSVQVGTTNADTFDFNDGPALLQWGIFFGRVRQFPRFDAGKCLHFFVDYHKVYAKFGSNLAKVINVICTINHKFLPHSRLK